MYKIFALLVLILAPVIVTIVSQFTPDAAQMQNQPSFPSSERPEAEVVMRPPPTVEAYPATIAPMDPSGALITGAPVIDPKGIDPTPQNFDSVSPDSEPPAQQETSFDGANNDQPNI